MRDSRLIFPKAVCFLEFAQLVCSARFAAVAFALWGFDPEETGTLLSIVPVVGMFGSLLWASVADRLRSSRWLLLAIVMGSGCAFCALPLLRHRRPLLAGALAAYAFCVSGVEPIVNAWAIRYITVRGGDAVTQWGRQRVFGAAAWGLVGLGVGALTSRFGAIAVFGGYAAATLLFALVVLAAPSMEVTDHPEGPADAGDSLLAPAPASQGAALAEPVTDKPDEDDGEGEGAPPRAAHSCLATLCTPLQSMRAFVFYAYVLCQSCGMGVVQSLLLYYIVHSLHGSATLAGVSLLVTVLPELVVYPLQGLLVSRLGVPGCFFLGAAAMVGRFLVYPLLTPASASWVLAAEPLHGVTTGFFYVTAVTYAGGPDVSHGRNRATAQAWVTALHDGAGLAIGSSVGGLLYHRFSPAFMFHATAVFVGASTVLYLLWVALGALCGGGSASRRPAADGFEGVAHNALPQEPQM